MILIVIVVEGTGELQVQARSWSMDCQSTIEQRPPEVDVPLFDTWHIVADSSGSCRGLDRPSSLPPSVRCTRQSCSENDRSKLRLSIRPETGRTYGSQKREEYAVRCEGTFKEPGEVSIVGSTARMKVKQPGMSVNWPNRSLLAG